eukprot:12536645-Ditylum_brightwellii.AAC.1
MRNHITTLNIKQHQFVHLQLNDTRARNNPQDHEGLWKIALPTALTDQVIVVLIDYMAQSEIGSEYLTFARNVTNTNAPTVNTTECWELDMESYQQGMLVHALEQDCGGSDRALKTKDPRSGDTILCTHMHQCSY